MSFVMRIELDKLKENGGRFAQVYEITELPLEDVQIRLVEPVEVEGRIRRDGSEVKVQGNLKTRLEALCDRCLRPVDLAIATGFSERYVQAVSWAADEQHELQAEDLNVAVFDGLAIELDDLVREELLLAVPSTVLCREDCKGLCPVCGIDRNMSNCECENHNIDSRWQGLSELKM
jgi:uncharacterized protein